MSRPFRVIASIAVTALIWSLVYALYSYDLLLHGLALIGAFLLFSVNASLVNGFLFGGEDETRGYPPR